MLNTVDGLALHGDLCGMRGGLDMGTVAHKWRNQFDLAQLPNPEHPGATHFCDACDTVCNYGDTGSKPLGQYRSWAATAASSGR
jgi:hypothetical protein